MGIKSIIAKMIPDPLYLKYKFKKRVGYPLNLKNPQTFNEKLQWLKLYDRNPIYNKLVDKYEVKRIVADRIGEKYVIPTIGVWDNLEQIDFDLLPKQFVLKATHDSGSYFICNDKDTFNIFDAKQKISKSLNHNFYYDGREWPYKNIKPRIIAEEFIGFFPLDYKFFVFGDKIDSVMVCKGREKGYPFFYFYDMNWNRLYYQHKDLEKDDQIDKPDNLKEMINIVAELSQGFSHVRIDLYNVNGKVFFGEYTFFDQSGFDTDITYETDLMWGKKIKLKKYNKDRILWMS